jgi:DNA-binding NarL/FixJ family response regulator
MFDHDDVPIITKWMVTSGIDAIERCRYASSRPEVILTDMQMPDFSGLELSQHMLRQYPKIRVIGLTAFDGYATPEQLRNSGIVTILSKTVETQTLVRIIGEAVGNTVVAGWIDRSMIPVEHEILLTEAEQNVLRLYITGDKVSDIAKKLYMSEGTIKTHLRKSYEKMGVHNRAQAIVVCAKRHLL